MQSGQSVELMKMQDSEPFPERQQRTHVDVTNTGPETFETLILAVGTESQPQGQYHDKHSQQQLSDASQGRTRMEQLPVVTCDPRPAVHTVCACLVLLFAAQHQEPENRQC